MEYMEICINISGWVKVEQQEGSKKMVIFRVEMGMSENWVPFNPVVRNLIVPFEMQFLGTVYDFILPYFAEKLSG
jgi:hypothetical protein